MNKDDVDEATGKELVKTKSKKNEANPQQNCCYEDDDDEEPTVKNLVKEKKNKTVKLQDKKADAPKEKKTKKTLEGLTIDQIKRR